MVHYEKNVEMGDERIYLPDLKMPCSGWRDYDRNILREISTINDMVYYFDKRLDLVFFNPMNNIFLKSAPKHSAVNGKYMSFFFLGAVMICSCIETLGGYILGRFNERDEAKERFNAFLDKYMIQWTEITPKGIDVKRWLWKNIRNALSHSFNINNGSIEDLGKDRYRYPV